MKKLGIICASLLLTMSAFGQSHQLTETLVESPLFQTDEYITEDGTKSDLSYYLEENIILAETTYDITHDGIVVISFMVNPDGTLSDYVVENSVSEYCDEAVINCLRKSSGQWQAGMVNKELVAMEQKVYVTFGESNESELQCMARDKLALAIKKYNRAIALRGNEEFTMEKREKRSTRKFNGTLYELEVATRYQPEEPSILFWQACTYKQLGDYKGTIEKLDKFMQLTNPERGLDYEISAVAFIK